jgi:photosystem II stability/assembly factor-like uncharacterized protein
MKRHRYQCTPVTLLVVMGLMASVPNLVLAQERVPDANSSPTPAPGEVPLERHWLNGPLEKVAFALAFSPEGDVLYAGTWGHGLYRSWDQGESWYPSGTGASPYIRALAVSPAEPKIVYTATYLAGLLRSTDGGAFWQQLGIPGPLVQLDPDNPHRSPLIVEDILLFSDGGEEQILVATRNGVLSSVAKENDWRLLDDGFADSDGAYNVQALARDSAGRLYAGTWDGLYIWHDGDQRWASPDDCPGEARQILSLAVLPGPGGDTLLIGTSGAGVYALDPESGACEPRNSGFDQDPRASVIQALLVTPDGNAYAGTVDYGVYVTTDGGRQWQQIAAGLPEGSRSVLALAQDPADGTLYSGTYGQSVFRFDPDSRVWEAANRGLPVDLPVQRINFAGPRGEHLLAGLQVGGLYQSSDRDAASPTWSRLPQALPVGPARDVAGLAVAGPDGATVVVAAGNGVSRSEDTGERWDHLGMEHGLPPGDVPASALAQGRRDDGILFVVLEGGEGIYRTGNGGANWQPVAGDLDLKIRTKACCLAVGADDDTVYLGLPSIAEPRQSVYVTRNGGKNWQELSPIFAPDLRELAWSQRSAWDVFLYGGPRSMLYARTSDGIYVSHDGGRSWQVRLRGFFSVLLADPYRPWMIYVASPATTVEKRLQKPISMTPGVWLSWDGGETWTWAGQRSTDPAAESPTSITALALDPEDKNRLYGGTEGTGVFWTEVPSLTRAFTPRAVASVVLLVLFLIVLAFIIWIGFSLGRPFGLPPQIWPKLAYLRIRHPNEVGLVSDRHTPLAALERLVLALAEDEPFLAESMWQRLNDEEIRADQGQVEISLEKLAVDYQLLRGIRQGYQLQWTLLGRMARARFWEDEAEKNKNIAEVQDQSRLRGDIRQFFKLAGFDAISFEDGFQISSTQPEYALLGAHQGIYVHPLLPAVVGTAPVREVRENAYRAYGGQLANRIAILVVACCPEIQALEQIQRLWWEEDFRSVLLPYSQIRCIDEASASRQVLDRSLRRWLGDENLFELAGPVRDPFDHYGRETTIQELAQRCEDGLVTGLTGMARVGKTSLLWQVLDRLPGALVAWLEPSGPPSWDLYRQLRGAWLAAARRQAREWRRQLPETPSGRLTLEQIQQDLDALCAALPDQEPAVHLVAVLDNVPAAIAGSEVLETLAQALSATAGASLLFVIPHPGPVERLDMVVLKPFDHAESAQLVGSLAAQMFHEFDAQAIDRLHRASGGHPLLLRQLASSSITRKRRTDQVRAEDVEAAALEYVAQPDSPLHDLWESLAEKEQEALCAALSISLAPSREILAPLERLGWLREGEGQWVLFSEALDRWLQARYPRQ